MRKILMACALLFSGSQFAFAVSSAEVVNKQPLKTEEMKPSPMDQFQQWYDEAVQSEGQVKAATFVLATVSDECEPTTRTMHAKVDKDGITFYGDLDSQKFQHLSVNPAAAVTFLWYDEQRQVNIVGKAVPVSEKEAKMAFDKLHKKAQITKHVSTQGEEIQDQDQMKKKHDTMSEQYKSKQVPTPKHWGGYRLVPETIEFWQAGPNSLDSRVVYVKNAGGAWEKKMLAP